MAIADEIVSELEHEMATTRTLLERVPDDRAEWKPHPKSMSMGELAQHIANLTAWGGMIVNRTELDLNPPEGAGFAAPRWASAESMLAILDAGMADACAAIGEATDAALAQSWTLKSGGHVIFTLPRAAVLRSFVLNHIVHHRGQLSVYLRLNDIPVPSIYGPTADTK